MSVYIKAAQSKKRRGAYFLCETCGEEFYVTPSYLKKVQDRNSTVRFCSMKCYDKTGDKNPFHGKRHSEEAKAKMAAHPERSRFQVGELNPNFSRFGTEFGFRGSRALWWRRFLLKTVGVCEKCGLSDKRILNLHHIDRDRSHNERVNLILLCWNCHALEHYEAKDGFYHFFKQDKERPKKESTDTA